jgi:hypothetical protein
MSSAALHPLDRPSFEDLPHDLPSSAGRVRERESVFQAGRNNDRAALPARQVHDRLQRALQDLKEAEKNAVLWFAEIHSRKLFRELGFSSIQQYAQEALGFSRGLTFQFLRLAERLQELPELRRSVEEGTVSWTKARVVASVATPATESRWIEEAKTKGRREIERQAEAAKARGRAARRRPVGQASLLAVDSHVLDVSLLDVPVEVVLRLRPEQYARMEALLVAARERGEKGGRVEILLAGLEALVTGAEAAKAAAGPRDISAAPRVNENAAPSIRDDDAARCFSDATAFDSNAQVVDTYDATRPRARKAARTTSLTSSRHAPAAIA